MVVDYRNGGTIGQLSAQRFGIKRLTPANGHSKDLEAQGVLANLVMHRLKFIAMHFRAAQRPKQPDPESRWQGSVASAARH